MVERNLVGCINIYKYIINIHYNMCRFIKLNNIIINSYQIHNIQIKNKKYSIQMIQTIPLTTKPTIFEICQEKHPKEFEYLTNG
jgi:hypothetical protein